MHCTSVETLRRILETPSAGLRFRSFIRWEKKEKWKKGQGGRCRCVSSCWAAVGGRRGPSGAVLLDLSFRPPIINPTGLDDPLFMRIFNISVFRSPRFEWRPATSTRTAPGAWRPWTRTAAGAPWKRGRSRDSFWPYLGPCDGRGGRMSHR